MNKVILIVFMALGLPAMIWAQSDDNNWRKKERKDKMEAVKIAYITQELDLTPEESQQFWPVYNRYQDQLQSLRKDGKPAKNPDDMTEAEADQHIIKRLDVEAKKLEYLKMVIQDLRPIIGSKRVIKIKDVENDFRKKILRKAGNRGDKGRKNKRGFRSTDGQSPRLP